MKKSLIILSGILSAFILISPSIIVISIIFPPLFFALMVLPTAFSYIATFSLLAFIMKPIGKLRWFISTLIIATISCGIPYHYNQAIYKQINNFTKSDIDIAKQINPTYGIAFLHNSTYNSRFLKNHCGILCQQLLYSGTAQKIFIGYDIKNIENTEHQKVLEFSIKKSGDCPAIEGLLKDVQIRVAYGECLIQKEGNIADANIVYQTENLTGRSYPTGWKMNLSAMAVTARRKTVRERTENGFNLLFQKTEIQAAPLAYPMYIGPSGGYQLQFYTALGRTELALNNFENTHNNDRQKIFGDLSNLSQNHESNSEELYTLIRAAFNDPSPKKQAGHILFEQHMSGLRFIKTPHTKADIEIVIQALKDDRISHFSFLPSFIRSLPMIPPELVQEMANRVLRKPSYGISIAIQFLPSGTAKNIHSQLIQIIKDPKLRNQEWRAITRLGDGNDDAVNYYMDIIKEWKEWRAKSKHITDTLQGSIVGLCHMGIRALPAKSQLMEISVYNSRVNLLIIDALLQMGLQKELEKKFQRTEFWPKIEGFIQKRRRSIKNKHYYCGRGQI